MTLTKNFEPSAIEAKWTGHWKTKGYYNSIPDDRSPFTVVIPPPNVTGVLHMGHTLNETVQDILVRKARMSGFNACWVPGSDHASIATEAKVVHMLKEKGINKNDLSREEFLKYAFEWKEKYGGIIYNQIERLGCSVDWNRVTFTMDDHYYNAVIRVFIDLYEKGLIYRGARMINWDPSAKTALSDEEVEYKEIQGKLYYIKYYIANDATDDQQPSTADPAGKRQLNDNFIVIATQRPETIMGDTGVCVNPTDERYAHLKGKKLIVPLVNREVPLIFDEYVDPAFGTGALKVTPAHDINDYNLGLKHHLPIIDTLNEDGTISEEAKVFVGLDRFAARKKAIEQLKEEGLLIKEEEYTTRIGYSQRTNAVVEPRISTQWFVKMKDLAGKALDQVVNGEIKIHPQDRFNATYKYWLENVKDWCISRQLWWGQRIPAWYAPDGSFAVADTKEKALSSLRKKLPRLEAEEIKQDEDVLDTWFSSWLWPMEVFNGISEPGNKDFEYYYPTSVLVTGQDIIFFWVARMIMAGMEYKDKKPFSDVYFTGMVRDKQGRKMSKQLGNSPDLLELISKYGADAVRFGIMISSPAGNDLLFDDSSCDQGRMFNNKLWNALKLIAMWQEKKSDHKVSKNENANKEFAVEWFGHRLNEVRSEVENLFSDFRLSEALKTIYSLIWDDFCSWYLEWVKPGFEQPVDAQVFEKTVDYFEQLMQLLHPFMPFITEEIYHQLRNRKDDITVKQFTAVVKADEKILRQGQLLKETITAIRDAKNKNQLKPRDPVTLHILSEDTNRYSAIETVISKQVSAEQVVYTKDPVPNTISIVIGKDTFFIQTNQELDTSSQREQLQKDLEYYQGFLISVDKKLSNERFVQNAKPEIVENERKKRADAEEKIRAIQQTLSLIS